MIARLLIRGIATQKIVADLCAAYEIASQTLIWTDFNGCLFVQRNKAQNNYQGLW
jgi:hypothetical protein